jgi:hypothetical protein
MPTGYPAAIDNFNNPTAVNNLSDAAVIHHDQHTNVNDAIKAIETELGLTPRGAAATVKARLDAIDVSIAAKVNSSLLNAASGVATLDAGSKLVQNVDSAKINSGIIAVARIPDLSGAKILGPGSGGATIPLNAVPALPASQTTSGVFAAAQIPNLDGAKITTGTVPAARLPSSVTANANSRVVADVAAMNAITAPERVDGLLVTVRSPLTLYVYRADTAAFVQQGGPGGISEPPVEVTEATDQLAFTSVSPIYGSPACWTTFTAPQSGKIFVNVHGNFESNTAGAIVFIGFEVRLGAVQGAGTVFKAFNSNDTIANGNIGRLLCSDRFLVTGLAVGTVYHCSLMHSISANNGDIFDRRLLIEMSH